MHPPGKALFYQPCHPCNLIFFLPYHQQIYISKFYSNPCNIIFGQPLAYNFFFSTPHTIYFTSSYILIHKSFYPNSFSSYKVITSLIPNNPKYTVFGTDRSVRKRYRCRSDLKELTDQGWCTLCISSAYRSLDLSLNDFYTTYKTFLAFFTPCNFFSFFF